MTTRPFLVAAKRTHSRCGHPPNGESDGMPGEVGYSRGSFHQYATVSLEKPEGLGQGGSWSF